MTEEKTAPGGDRRWLFWGDTQIVRCGVRMRATKSCVPLAFPQLGFRSKDAHWSTPVWEALAGSTFSLVGRRLPSTFLPAWRVLRTSGTAQTLEGGSRSLAHSIRSAWRNSAESRQSTGLQMFAPSKTGRQMLTLKHTPAMRALEPCVPLVRWYRSATSAFSYQGGVRQSDSFSTAEHRR